ncbi:MAG TPA: P22 phage major capsid protein family protein [Pyrinomonadaceae bacterium]|nr:P22 phage major capsid protein family protein [Pyrinomonadaceae bacterium]
MANIKLTTADTAGFIPQAWAQRALDILRSAMCLARIVAKDNECEPGWQGKTLNIPYPGTFTAQSKSADTPATVQVPSGGATVQVTLNSHQYVDFIVEDFAAAQANTNLMDRYVRGAAIALGNKVEDDLFALYSSLSTSVGTSGTDISASTIRSARKKLNDNLAPTDGRALIVSSKDEIALLGDTSLQTYFAFADPQKVAEGSMGRPLYGFDVYMSQRVPIVAGSPNSTKCLALCRDAFILATRPFRDLPPGSGVQATTISDPETGLIIRVVYQYDIANRGMRVGFDILYGVALLRDPLATVVLT